MSRCGLSSSRSRSPTLIETAEAGEGDIDPEKLERARSWVSSLNKANSKLVEEYPWSDTTGA